MAVSSDGDDNLYVSDFHRVTKVVYKGYRYYAEIIAGVGGQNGKRYSYSIDNAAILGYS